MYIFSLPKADTMQHKKYPKQAITILIPLQEKKEMLYLIFQK